MFLRMLLVFCQSEAECSINEVLDKKKSVSLHSEWSVWPKKKINKPSRGNSMRHQHLYKRDGDVFETCVTDWWTDGWTDGRTDGRTDGWMDRRTDTRMDGWTNEWMDSKGEHDLKIFHLRVRCPWLCCESKFLGHWKKNNLLLTIFEPASWPFHVTHSLWKVNFSSWFFLNSDCRFRFLSKKYLHNLPLLFQNSFGNTIKNTKN